MKDGFHIVKTLRVNTPKTLLTLKRGQSVKVKAKNFAALTTVKSAACRMNQRRGWTEYEVMSPDNGETLIITRNILAE